jgi:hexulose-6-phosphate isomerase
MPNRREFLQGVAGAALLQNAATSSAEVRFGMTQSAASTGPKKAVMFSMLPTSLSIEDRFKLTRDVGFDGVESSPIGDPAECERMRTAAEKAGIRVHSVIYGGWGPPLTHPDEQTRAQSIKNAEEALHSAKRMGADDILLVPGIVDATTTYRQAWDRSHAGIHRLIPVAAELGITICIEEVWNNFLLSPLEMVAYIDSFKSPWVKSYFDVGNVVMFAWPQDWIRTLGNRIHKVHLKDYKGGPGLFGAHKGDWANLGDGSIDWAEVKKAFHEIGYTGFMTTELSGGDEAYLRDLAGRVDRLLLGA